MNSDSVQTTANFWNVLSA